MWEVYAYWNTEQLEAIFNGVAAISNASAYTTLTFTLVLLGFIVVMGTAVARLRAEEPMVWIFFLTFFYGVLFLPKDDVVIIDRTAAAGAPRVVANVPLGLAFFAHATSKTGDWLTRSFETVFALPQEVRFTGNGMLFGSRIIRGAMASHLLDVGFNNDLMEYVKTCVAPDLLTGYKNLETLMKSEDIWGEMGDTNPARAVWIGGGTLTCPDAYTNLNNRLPAALQAAHLNMARLINPNAAMTAAPAALNGLLAAQIPAAADVLMRVSTANSLDFVRQAIMVNFWRDAPGSLASAVENTSAAQLAIAQSQAQASANSAYLTMAAVAEGALPKIRNVVQIIIIAIFPIVLILVLMAGHKGGVVLKSYVMAMVWIELWPVLYAVTSYVAHLAAAPGVSSGLIGGLAGVPAGPGLSLLNSINIEDTLLRDEAVAGMFSLLIPVMAYAILKGGEVAMSGLASQLMAPATSAAQKTGGEAGLGNLSMGNVRYDTFAARTSMANSWSTRPSIDSGAGGGYRHTDPSLRETTKATGSVRQDAETIAAGMPVVQATPSSLGGVLSAGAGTSAGNTSRSEHGATAGQVYGGSVTKADGSHYSESGSARFMRELTQAVNRDWQSRSGYGQTWGSGSQGHAGVEMRAEELTRQAERGQVTSRAGFDAQAGTVGSQSQTHNPNLIPKPGGTLPAQGVPAGLQPEPVTSVGTRGAFGPRAGVGIDAAGVAELAYTAATGASNRYGLNREQAAEVLRQASRSVSAQTGDHGVKSSAEDFTARLDRGFTVLEARSMEASLRDAASESRERSLSSQDQSRHDLDTWVQSHAAGQGIGPAALADIRQTDPARFRALVNEARSAWEASGEGQSHLAQGSSISAPRAPDEVFSQGVGDRNRLLAEGWSELDTRHAAHERYVQGRQPASPGSAPDLKPIIARVSTDEQAAFRQYQSSEAGQKYQAGVAILASQAVRDEHGPLAPLRTALGILAPKSPEEVMERIHHLAAADPNVRAQIEHLGATQQPSERQIKGVAEYIEARAAAVER
ncbi:MAG: conjugal transfer protein TraG N-terminal domain-containing protein [Pseudomonadota bacterium]